MTMDSGAPELPVDQLDVLRQRRSAKWQTYPADVLPLTVAEMDFRPSTGPMPGTRWPFLTLAEPSPASPPAGGTGTWTRRR